METIPEGIKNNRMNISVSVPLCYLLEMDKYVDMAGETRSGFITNAIKEKLERIGENV